MEKIAEETSETQAVEQEEIDDAINKLIAQGINWEDVKNLEEAGIHTCNALMMRTKKELTGIKGLSEAKVDEILEAAKKIVEKTIIFQSMIQNLKSCLEDIAKTLGVKGALFCLDEEGKEIDYVLAFPSTEEIVYANVGFATVEGVDYFEYEDEKLIENKEITEDEKKDKKLRDEKDALVLEQLFSPF